MKRFAVTALSAAVALAGLTVRTQADQTPPHLGYLVSRNISDIEQGYGRAGGHVGWRRVADAPSAHRPPVEVAYDKETEARTHMPTNHAASQHVLTTWDEGIAKRTHMPLAEENASRPPYVAPRAVQ